MFIFGDSCKYIQVSALGSSKVSAPQRFKCISIMGDSNWPSTTACSRGDVLSKEGPFLEVSLYILNGLHINQTECARQASKMHIFG